MNVRVTSSKWDDEWEGSLDELLDGNVDMSADVEGQLRGLPPGSSLDFVVGGVSYEVTCLLEDGVDVPESLAQALETTISLLRRRGVVLEDEVDLSGLSAYRSNHPRLDA